MKKSDESHKNAEFIFFVEGESEKIRISKHKQFKDLNNANYPKELFYNDAFKRNAITEKNLNERIHSDIFAIAQIGIDDLSRYTKEEQHDIKVIRECANKVLFDCLRAQILFLMFIAIVDIFWIDVPEKIYDVFAITIIGNLATLIAIIIKYGFTNYIKDYYSSFGKIIEVLGSVNNAYFKTKTVQTEETLDMD